MRFYLNYDNWKNYSLKLDRNFYWIKIDKLCTLLGKHEHGKFCNFIGNSLIIFFALIMLLFLIYWGGVLGKSELLQADPAKNSIQKPSHLQSVRWMK